MKKQLVISISILIFYLFTSSCSPSCNKTCKEHGICNDGNCTCIEGFYGDNCEFSVQDDFIGLWIGVDCFGGKSEITITKR